MHTLAWNLDTYTGKDDGIVRVGTRAQMKSSFSAQNKNTTSCYYLGTMLPQHRRHGITGDSKLLPRPHPAAVQYSSGSAVLRSVLVEEFVDLHDLWAWCRHLHHVRKAGGCSCGRDYPRTGRDPTAVLRVELWKVMVIRRSRLLYES